MATKSTGSKKGQQDYHHGDLRRALITEAMKVVAKDGVEALTLRDLARRVGVSHAAPYRHFPDKKALLKELAEEGFRDLLRTLREAAAGKPDRGAVEQMKEVAWSYVRFALAQPERLGIMFGPELSRREDDNCLMEPAEKTFDFVTQSIDEGKRAGMLAEGETLLQAVAAWALVHGLSVLLINGRLQKSELSHLKPESLSKAITQILMEGLQRKSRPSASGGSKT